MDGVIEVVHKERLTKKAAHSALYVLIKCKAKMEATSSSKNQIVIPREARKSLGVKSGDKLLIVPHGNAVIVLAKPESYSAAILG